MSPPKVVPEEIPTILEDYVSAIQKISQTESLTVHFGIADQQFSSTSRLSDNGKCVTTQDGDKVYAVASLFKIFISVAAFLMFEKLSENQDSGNPYRGLRGALDLPFTQVFNDFKPKIPIKLLYGMPTVREIISHVKGVCDMNHIILAPEGSAVVSKDDFLSNISRFSCESHEQKDSNTETTMSYEYSNANIILIALLIELVSDMTLAEFLQEHIFRPLDMGNTYTSVERLGSLSMEQRPQPHVVSSKERRKALVFDEPRYMADTVELAALGAYMSASDIGKFFTAILKGRFGDPVTYHFDRHLCKSMMVNSDGINAGAKHSYTPLGLSTTLDTDLPGCNSLNRLLCPEGTISKSVLGRQSDNQQVAAFYAAGSATGWACTVYLIPKQEVFVICLTNTSGPLDASDLISRLYLQEILDLQRPAPEYEEYQDSFKDPKTLSRAYYVELAGKGLYEGVAEYARLERDDDLPETPCSSYPAILGRYETHKFNRVLTVDTATVEETAVLRITISSGKKSSSPMRLVRTDKNVFRICSIKSDTQPGLAIDCFGDWSTLELTAIEEDGLVVSLCRKGLNVTDMFTRERVKADS